MTKYLLMSFMKPIMRVLFGLLAVLASVAASQAPAQTFNTYNDSYLFGCYSFVVRTSDVPNSPLFIPTYLKGNGMAHLGVMCFDGSSISHKVTISDLVDVNGTLSTIAPAAVNYNVNSAVGAGGVGWIQALGLYGRFAIALNNVSGGLAHGFQLLKYLGNPSALVMGGTAYYQGPNSTTHTNAVLNGCYTHLGETVATNKLVGNGKDLLGVLCFSGTNVIRKYWTDVNGVTVFQSNTSSAGSYLINDSPYSGMGTITFNGGQKWAVAVNNVSCSICAPGVAGGYQLMQITAPTNAKILTGTAFLQQ